MEGISVFEVLLVSTVLLTNIALVWAALTRARDKNLGISFAVFIATVILWVGSAFVSEVLSSGTLKILLTKLAYAGVIMAFPSLVKFLGFLQSEKVLIRGWTMRVITATGVVLALLTILTGNVVAGIFLKDSGFDINFGPYYVIFVVYALMYGLIIIYLLGKGYLASTGEQRRAYRLVVAGISIFTVVNILVNVVLPELTGNQNFYRYGNYSVVFFTSLATYSIVAHNLFEIRAFSTATAAIAVNVLLISKLFLSQGLSDFFVNLLLAVSVGLGSLLLVSSIGREISRRHELERLAKEKIQTLKELEQRNKNLGTLQRISDIVLQEIELRPMVQKILDEIPVQMDTAVGALVTLVQNGKLEAYTFSANEFSRKINALVGPDLSKYAYPLHKSYNKLHDALLERVVHESSNLADFVSPPLPKTMAVMLQKLIGAKYCLALPLYVGKENLGVMLFVFKVSKDQLNSKDLEMAQAIANDTTLAIERSQAFQKLKDANEYLSQLDKMKDEFISVASHELNTPLAAIEGYLSMILDEGMGKIDDKSRMYLGRVYDSSKRLAELILDLLNTSRIEQGRLKMKYSEVNLAELIQSVIHELQIKADGKKIYLKMEAPKVVPLLWCDPDRIREVIVNLTGNAIKFTEKGGVTIKIEQPDHTLRVSVIDTGRGIDKADQNKLFQKFSQVKREVDEHQGTGLGLYISKSFVDLHKGRLWVESEAGKGASFIFELPIIDKPPKEVPGAILESTFGSPRIEVGTKDAPAIIAASSKKSS